MSLEEKVEEVVKLFILVDNAVAEFRKESKLRCLRTCSRCCNPRIHATVLEFLPLAYWFHKKGVAREWLIKLREEPVQEERNCILLKYLRFRGDFGRCSVYKMRPLVCRLFGFAAVLDKNLLPKLVTCQVIKTAFRENYIKALSGMGTSMHVPVMKDYYMMLYAIDPTAARIHYPIRTALRMAIEMVLGHFTYQRSEE